MSTTDSSTPSRKRSKWEHDENQDDAPLQPELPPVKRRSKPKVSAAIEPVASVSSSRTTHASRAAISTNHSAFVPPRTRHPPISPSRSVYCYERLNQIEEGSYGVVFRAKDKATGEIVALKRLKLDEEKHGFPITALREINALMVCRHENVVNVREVVVGDTLTQCVSSLYRLCYLFWRMTHIIAWLKESLLSWTSLSTISRLCSQICQPHSYSRRSRLSCNSCYPPLHIVTSAGFCIVT
jgi:serine/threonine protein kinase